MNDQQIQNDSDPKKFFTMIPNLVDDSNLDPYEFRLYVHYCRVGNCWEGTKTTARKCNMSMGAVSKKRRSLKAKGWITLQEPSPDNPTDTIKIGIVSKWGDNFNKYDSSPHETPPSPDERPPSLSETPPSPDETKNTNTKNNQTKKSVAVSPQHPPLTDFLNEWKRLFPNKPQPRAGNKKLQKQWATRFKDDGFKDDWLSALSVAARSATCQSESWFNAGYFLRSEETWTNCLGDWMKWKDEKQKPKQSSRTQPTQPKQEIILDETGRW